VHQPREITKPLEHGGKRPGMWWLSQRSEKRKQFIIHTSYTAPPKPECIERERDKVQGMVVGGVGKTMSKFFFTSHLIAAGVKYRPYRGKRVEL
jgi:hypothetical protein